MDRLDHSTAGVYPTRSWRKSWIIGLAFAMLPMLTFAQAPNTYQFQTGTTGTNATLDPMTGSTVLTLTGDADDAVTAVTPIGFSFTFNGVAHTQFSANSNGLMRLGATAISNQWSNTAGNGNSNAPAIMPYWDDLATGTTGQISYVLLNTGSFAPPNRRLVVQWFLTVPRNTGGAANATFQCWLDETANAITFVYGAGLVANSGGASIGILSATAVYNTVNSTSHTNSTSTFTTNNTAAIATPRYYRFSPPCAPAATASLVYDCANSRFFVDVNVTNLSGAASVNVGSDYAGNPGGQTAVGLGTYQIGPFPDLASVNVSVVNSSNSGCNLSLGSFTSDCANLGKNALSFDGVNDMVNCGTPASINITGTTMTMEAWVYPTSFRTNVFDGNVINREGTAFYAIRVGGSGVMNAVIKTTSGTSDVASSSNALVLNTWQHLAVTYDGTTVRLYVNGTQITTGARTGNLTSDTSTPLAIGNAFAFPTRSFPGKIDEVRLWNVARTPAEITAGMNTLMCGNETGLVAYYRFDQGNANANNTGLTTLTDLTANANNGTLTNFALSGTTSNWVSGKTGLGACVPVTCPSPIAQAATGVTAFAAQANWTDNGGGGTWIVEYGPSATFTTPGTDDNPGPNGTVVLNAVAPQAISPLLSNTSYRYFVRQNCGGGNYSLNSAPITFTTPVSCLPPSALVVSGVTFTSANLSWAASGSAPADGYEWEVRTTGAGGSGGTGLAASGTTAAGIVSASTGPVLTANTNHNLYVRANCGAGDFSTWTGPVAFRTGYCVPAPSSVDGSGITNVSFSSVNNSTGAEAGNYADYSAMVGNISRGTTVPVNITYATGYTYDTKIWIDWNDDLDFADAGEEVYVGTSTSDNPTTLAASFTVSLTAPAGQHRMRIGGQDAGPATPCYNSTYGTFEDYTVNVLPCTPPSATVAVSTDCGNNQFFLTVNVTSLGDATAVDIRSDQPGNPGGHTAVGIGSYQIGPFPSQSVVVATVAHSDNALCDRVFGSVTFDCSTVGQNALSFDGTDDRVDIGTQPAVTITGNAITLEAWIYPTAWKTNRWEGTIINKEGNNVGYMLRAGANGTLSFALGNGSTIPDLFSSTGALTLNTWQHVAGTYDGTTMRIYVNGVEKGTQAQSITIANSTNPLRIGDWSSSGGRAFAGRIDEVRIWTVARTDQEVLDGMSVLMCGNEPGLKAYYRFDQGLADGNNAGATTLNDQSIYVSNGTLSGFALNGTSSNWVLGKTGLGACVPVACPAPIANAATNVGAFSAEANWSTTGGSGTWIVEYGPAATFTTPGIDANPGTNGTVILNAVAPQLIPGLNEETQYRYFVRQDCGLSTFSVNSAGITFTTTPSCFPPQALTTADQTTTSATLSWSAAAVAPSVGYQWEVRTSGAGGSGATGLVLNGTTLPAELSVATGSVLTPNTNYFLYVRSDCGAGDFSSWSGPAAFRTGYCIPAPSSVGGAGIINVSYATVNNSTGLEPGNYGDFSALVGSVGQGSTVPVNITFSTGATYDTKIWVDWNDDLDFTDVGEEMYSGTSVATSPTTLAASIAIGSNPLGQHRMRIGAVDVGPPTPCYTGTLGTYEDYAIDVLPCIPPIASATVVQDCANGRFFISVNVSSVGDAANVDVMTDYPGNPGGQAGVGTGTVQVGPFPDLSSVTVSIVHNGNSQCTIDLGPYTFNCATLGFNALSFDGTNDRVNCGNGPSLDITGNKITLEAWIHPTSWRTESWRGNIINKEGAAQQGYMLRCGANGTLSFNLGASSSWQEVFSPAGALVLNTWQHVAGTYDGTTMRVYINGVQVGSAAGNFTIASSPNPVVIGDWAVPPANERCFPGKIDEVRIWNRSLSASVLQAHMNTAYCGNETGLVAYYKFDQGVRNADNSGVTTLTDLTANANNGTLANFTLNGATSNWVEGQTNMGACVPVTCFGPTTIGTANVGANSADVNWTCAGCTGTFVLEYGPAGFVPGTGATAGGGTVIVNATSPTSLTGLAATTTYDVYIRQNCGVEGYSENSSAAFTTALGCGGNFYDSGGPSGSYGNMENNVRTICPNAPGELVTVTFSAFDVEASWDALYVFNGTSTADPKIASANGAPNSSGNNVYGAGGWWGTTAPNNIAPNVVRASNPTGCLTFAFTSDGSGVPAGWAAAVTCYTPNNTCANRDTVVCGNLYSGFTTGVSHSQPASCAFNGDPSTGGQNWWVYNATANEEVTISTCGASSFDLRLSVFTGTGCEDLTCYAAADDSPGCSNGSAEVTFPVTAGSSYFIMVHGAGAAEGTYQMAVSCAPLCSPASGNDACANAASISAALLGTGVMATGDNSCAHNDAPTSCSGALPVQGAWYTFNSGVYQHFTLTLRDNGDNPAYTATTLNYALFSGACSGLGASDEVICVNDASGVHVLDVLPNTDYRLLVYNSGGVGVEGTFGLMLEHPAPYDASVSAIVSPQPGLFCSTLIEPVVTLTNLGDVALTTVQFVYDIDGGATQTYNWTGELAYQASVNVTLPGVTTSPGVHTLNVATALPNGQADGIPGNDGQSVSVDISGESVVVSVRTDANGDQTTWQIYDSFFFVVAQGGPYTGQDNAIISTTACLPTTFGNCYSFFIFDAFGDGLCCANGNGFWELRTSTGAYLLRDRFMATPDGFQSPAAAPAAPGYVLGHEFCLPPGPSNILADECGVFTNTLQSKVFARAIPGVSQYQFEFSDPDAGFRRFITLPRNWVKFSEMQTSPLIPGTVYFARVRADQGAVGLGDDHFGTGCEMGLTTSLGCAGLIDDISLPTHSCGVTRHFNTSEKVWANPMPGATQYRFRFSNPGEGFTRYIDRPSYICQLGWFTAPLQVGVTYDVQVEVLVNTVWSGFCGPVCQVTIVAPGARPEHRVADAEITEGAVQLWPNPVGDGRVHLLVNGLIEEQQHISVDLYDLFGKKVMAQQYENAGEVFNTVLEVPSTVAKGVYLVNITINGATTVQRLTVQ